MITGIGLGLGTGGAQAIKLNRAVDAEIAANAAARASYATGADLGKVMGQYSAIQPGPLPNNLAGTFAGGRYTEIVLKEDTVLYRAGTADQPLGQFFSMEAPAGIVQTRVDKAILPYWPGGGTSPINSSIAVRIPAGTKVYVGEVGGQNGFYVGGTRQIVVQKPWTIDGVKVINIEPIK